jgi:3-oxoacyl-[acyl-carrier protein] reductase
MDLGIRGRKAICAGASAGMGRASALALAREGVEVFLSARGQSRLEAAAAAITAETGTRVTPVVADHSTEAGRAAVLAACPDPDIMVITCSPPEVTAGYRDITPEDWRASFETTCLGPIELMRATAEGMAERGFGRIVNIATGAAKAPAMIRMLSGPTRSALVNYTVALSKLMAPRNVIINNLLPGMFHTDTIRERFGARARAAGTSYEIETQKFVEEWRIPAGRFGDPEELGAFCALLCSRFAGFTVGQSLVMDGGLINTLF